MSGSQGDLDIKITGDASEVTAAMTETRTQLEQTVTTINVQDQSWRSLAVSVVQSTEHIAPAVAQITTAIAGLAGTVAVINHQKAMLATLMSPLQAAGSAFVTYGGLAARGIGMIAPQWKLATTAVSVGLLAYKVATSEMSESAYKVASDNANVSESVDRLNESLGRLGDAAAAPFGLAKDGAESLLQSLNPMPFIFGNIAKVAVSATDAATAGIDALTPKVVEFGDVMTTAAFVTSSWGSATADSTAKFYEETRSLRELAVQTAKVIALQESRRPLFAQLGAMQDAASETAKHNAEIARLGSLTTVEAIESEIRALQKKAAAEILAGTATEASQKRAAEAFNVLANQKAGVESGRIKPPESSVDAAISASRMELVKLTQGEDAAAIAAMRLKASTDDEKAAVEAGIPAFLAAREAVREATKAKDEQKQIADLLKKSAEEEAATQKRAADQIAALSDKINVLNGSATSAEVAMRQLSEQGFNTEAVNQISGLNAELDRLTQAKSATEKVTSLKDQIDLLSGAATSAEIAMRELGRAGFTDAQIAEIGALTDQLDALRESQKKQPKEKADKGSTSPTVALQGTKEAAEIMLRGVGGGSKLEKLGESQLAEQRKIAAAVSAKPIVQPVANQASQPTINAPQASVPANVPPVATRVAAPVFSTPVIPPLPAAPEAPEPPQVNVAVQSPVASPKPTPNLSPLVPRSVTSAAVPVPAMPAAPTPPVAIAATSPQPVVDFGQSLRELHDSLNRIASAKPVVTDMGGGDFGSPASNVDVEALAKLHQEIQAIGAGGVTEPPANEPTFETAVASAPVAGPVQSPITPRPLIPAVINQPAQVLPSSPPSSVAAEPVVRPDVSVAAVPQPRIAIPSPVVETKAPDAATVAIPTPKVSPPVLPSVPPVSIPSPTVSVNPPTVAVPKTPSVAIGSPLVSVPRPATVAIPAPTIAAPDIASPKLAAVPPINVPSPSVNVGSPLVAVPSTPSIAIAAPKLSAPNVPPVSIPSPAIQSPKLDSIAVPAPVVMQPKIPGLPPVDIPTPSVNVGMTPSVSVETPTVPSVGIPAPQIAVPNLQPVSIPAPAITTPQVTSASVAIPQPQTLLPRVPTVSIPSPEISTPRTPAISIPSPLVDVPRVAASTIAIPSPEMSLPTSRPVAIPSPDVTAPETPSVTLASPLVSTPKTPPLKIESPEVTAAAPQAPKIAPTAISPPEVTITPLPLRPITLDAPEISVAKLPPIQSAVSQANVPESSPIVRNDITPKRFEMPTIEAPKFAQQPVTKIPEAATPIPKLLSINIPELPRVQPPSLDKFSGMSARAERSVRDGFSESERFKSLEKLAASQLAELKLNTAAVRANKPQQFSVGSV